jgi:hypothetical protein
MTSDTMQPTTPNASPGRRSSERGSAMIIALMIMIVLTLLGVTFLVLAEQEQQISVNERDLTQVLYVAEAGVEVAKTWFNQPDLASNPFKPPGSELTLSLREGQDLTDSTYKNADERSATPGTNVTGDYLGGDGIPFEKEYRGSHSVEFWGRRDTPDVLVCAPGSGVDLDGDGTEDDCNSPAPGGFMDDLNDAIASMPSAEHEDRDFGDVSVQQIRVYRPPLDYDLKARYGVATIESIAVKRVRGNRIVTDRSVRDVVQEIPFPGPGGAIETEADVGQSGSAGVHWGPVVSAAFDSTDDHINLPNASAANFPESAIPRETPARWGFHHTINPAAGDNLSSVPTGSDGPNNTQAFTALTELLGITQMGKRHTGGKAFDPITVGDPWLLFRARNQVRYDNGAEPLDAGSQPHPYNSLQLTIKNGTFDKNLVKGPTWSHMFQRQIVRFPPISYDTWKEIVRSGQEGMFYLTYVAASDPPTWRLNGSGDPREFSEWVNRDVGLGPGVYFFETTDGIAPHDDDEDGTMDNLTPGTAFEKVGANEAYMEGFGLLYSEFLSSTGVGKGLPADVNMPSEVFLDDGIDLHDGSGVGDDCICIRFDVDTNDCVLGLAPIQWGRGNEVCGPAASDCKCSQAVLSAMDPDVAKREATTFRNNEWDSDIDNNGEADGQLDSSSPGWAAFVATPDASGLKGHAFEHQRLPHYEIGDELLAGKFPQDRHRDPRFLNEDLGTFSASDRQPHEPFLNFDYPSTASIVGWDNDNGVITDYDHSGDAMGCEYQANDRVCETVNEFTSVSRDSVGALMQLQLNVNGVLYCEGYYTGTGNMKVFGSMMMRGGYGGGASLDVWFNEELVEGKFPPVEWELPRIFTSARDTD